MERSTPASAERKPSRRADSRGRTGGARRQNMRSQRRPLSVAEVQDLLRDKIERNFRSFWRVLRLFDLNCTGFISKHELHRILDHQGVSLSERDFSRFWRAHSLDSSVSYVVLLESLGFESPVSVAPVCSRIGVCSRESQRSLRSRPGSESVPPALRAGLNPLAERRASPRRPDPCPVAGPDPKKRSLMPEPKTPVQHSSSANDEEKSLFKHLSFSGGPEERYLIRTSFEGSGDDTAAQRKQTLKALKIRIKNEENGQRFVDVQEFSAEQRSLKMSSREEELRQLLQRISLRSSSGGRDGEPRTTSAERSPESSLQPPSSKAKVLDERGRSRDHEPGPGTRPSTVPRLQWAQGQVQPLQDRGELDPALTPAPSATRLKELHQESNSVPRPKTGLDQRPGTKPDQKTGTGSNQRPETGLDQRPEAGPDQRTGTGSNQRPETGLDQRPGTKPDQRPGTKPDQRPGTGPYQRPETGLDQRPGTKPDQRPGTEPNQEPWFSSDKRPGTGLDQKPGTGLDQRPWTGLEQKPGTGLNQRPWTSQDQRPGTGPNQRPGTELNQRPGTRLDHGPGTGPNQRPGTGLDQRPGTEQDQRPGTGRNQRPKTGLEQRPGTGTNQRPKPGPQKYSGAALDQEQKSQMELSLVRALRRNWRRILKNCSVFDSEELGWISTENFLKILEGFHLRATVEQLESLQPDSVRRGQVHYHQLLQHCLGPDRGPGTGGGPWTRLRLQRDAHMNLSAPGPDCAAVMLRIYPRVRSCWTPLRRDFLSADPPERRGWVPVLVFKKVLSQRGLVLSKDDWFHLLSHFDPAASGSVCYKSFLWAFPH